MASANVTTPREVQADVENLPKVEDDEEQKRRRRRALILKGALAALGLGVACLLLAGILTPALILTQTTTTTSSTVAAAAAVTTGTTTVTNTTTVTTVVTTTGSTTTVTCASGYTQTSAGTCVNTQIDFNNCGSVGYVCSSNYTSCSAGTCSSRPAVALPGAIAVPGFNTSTGSIDDAMTVVSLPVNLTLYNYTTDTVTVTTNGVICLGGCSIVWTNTALPTSSFSGPTVLGFWDDLMIYTGTSQTIYYGVSGTAPNRETTFEFYESHFTSSTQYYHFQVTFFENQPNVVKCMYFDMSLGGSSGTIGVQASSSGSSIQYAFNQANATTYNMTLVFDTNTGSFTG